MTNSPNPRQEEGLPLSSAVARLEAAHEAAVRNVKCSICGNYSTGEGVLCPDHASEADKERDDAIERGQIFRAALQEVLTAPTGEVEEQWRSRIRIALEDADNV